MNRTLLAAIALSVALLPAAQAANPEKPLPAQASAVAKAKQEANAAKKDVKNAGKSAEQLAEEQALAAEEKDRLERENKDKRERADMLQKQLDTGKKLLAEKEAQAKQLEEQIRALKAGDQKPAK